MLSVVPHETQPSLPQSHELLALVKQQATKLVPPLAAMKAIRLADNRETTASQIATVISSDIRLTTQLLALANSSSFAPAQPLIDIRAAVSRLGMKRVRNLIMATALGGVMKQMPMEVEWATEAINQHGRLTACVSSKLAGLLPVGLQGEEFTAGMIHDIGRLALFSLLGSAALDVDPLSFDELEDPRIHERELLGTDHTEVGTLLLTDVGFPESLLEVIWCHHEPGLATENPTLVALVAVADAIANQLQREEGPFELGAAERVPLSQLCALHEWDVESTCTLIENSGMESLIDEARCLFES